ncbi:MAG: hypothetical protein V7711_01405 [Pseudomonadales bacterium]
MATSYGAEHEPQGDIFHYLVTYYNWIRPHQYYGVSAPAAAEEKLNSLPENS